MLCAFMCSYSTLPMIGTGCGISTDHFARSGVIGNGASPKCGMPASLATLETATDGGVVDDPMMMSALDSVTKRRALVVALVGSPPSSSTITLSGTPPISFGTNSSALRSGMPRSEEHTSELQSLAYLVCRLLLEKKKKIQKSKKNKKQQKKKQNKKQNK